MQKSLIIRLPPLGPHILSTTVMFTSLPFPSLDLGFSGYLMRANIKIYGFRNPDQYYILYHQHIHNCARANLMYVSTST